MIIILKFCVQPKYPESVEGKIIMQGFKTLFTSPRYVPWRTALQIQKDEPRKKTTWATVNRKMQGSTEDNDNFTPRPSKQPEHLDKW